MPVRSSSSLRSRYPQNPFNSSSRDGTSIAAALGAFTATMPVTPLLHDAAASKSNTAGGFKSRLTTNTNRRKPSRCYLTGPKSQA
jgi:hypothetical protein